MATLTNYSTFILFFITLFIIQIELIQMYPTTTGSMGNVNDGHYYDDYPSSYPTSQSMMNQQDYYQQQQQQQQYPYQQQQQYPIMTNTRRRPHIRSDVRKILVEKLSTDDADHTIVNHDDQRSSSKQQQHHLCNATIISSRRLLIPNECSPNGYNRMETIQLYNPDQNNNDTKIIQRQGRTIVRLQRSKSSLVELNETIPGTTDNDDNNVNGQFRQENFQSPPSLNEEPIYNDNYDDLDGRQYLPIFPPMPPPPMPPPMPPIIPGYIYEYEYFEYQFCRPLHIEISICELCIWIPNVCPIMF